MKDVLQLFFQVLKHYLDIILYLKQYWRQWLTISNMSPFGGRYYCYDWLLLSIFSQYWSASVLILIQILLIFCVHLLGESHLVFWKFKYYLKTVEILDVCTWFSSAELSQSGPELPWGTEPPDQGPFLGLSNWNAAELG